MQTSKIDGINQTPLKNKEELSSKEINFEMVPRKRKVFTDNMHHQINWTERSLQLRKRQENVDLHLKKDHGKSTISLSNVIDISASIMFAITYILFNIIYWSYMFSIKFDV